MRLLVVWVGAGAAVALQDVDAKTALQRLADSARGRFRLSMCPDVAARPLTLHTDRPMPFAEFVTLVARQLGATVDLRWRRHLQGSPSVPHLYPPCMTSRFVYVFRKTE